MIRRPPRSTRTDTLSLHDALPISARDLVLDPRDPRLPRFYPLALDWGFRRSDDLVYRPHCGDCRACVAVRVPVADFVPDRSQRRCLRRNADVTVRVVPTQRTDEQLALYQRYLRSEEHTSELQSLMR